MKKIAIVLMLCMVLGCQSRPPVITAPTTNDDEVGRQAFASGSYDRAVEAYDRWLATHPERLDIVFERGRAYNELRQYEQALQDFDTVVTQNPNDLRAHIYRSGVLITLKKLPEAGASLNKVLTDTAFPQVGIYERFLAYLLDGQLKNMRGEHEAALVSLEDDIKLFEQNSEMFQRHGLASLPRWALYHKAVANDRLGNYRQAAADMEEYILLTGQSNYRIDNKDYKSLARALFMAEDYDKCRKVLPNLSPEDRRELGTALGDMDFFVSTEPAKQPKKDN